MFLKIFYTICLFLSFYQITGLRAKPFDKTILAILRSLFLIAIGILLFSPKFENVTRVLESPEFLILEDKTASVAPFKQAGEEIALKLEQFLSNYGLVNQLSFPKDSLVKESDSIVSNLNKFCQQSNYRAIFIISDFRELASQIDKDCQTKIYTIAKTNQDTFLDSGIEILNKPDIAYLNQEVLIRLKVYANDPTLAQVSLSLDNQIIEKRTLKPSLLGEIIEFRFKLDKVGERQLELNLKPLKDELFLDNNQISFPLMVKDKSFDVLFLANSPSFASMQFLRRIANYKAVNIEPHYLGNKEFVARKKYAANIIFGKLKQKVNLDTELATLVILDSKPTNGYVYPSSLTSNLEYLDNLKGELLLNDLRGFENLASLDFILKTIKTPESGFFPKRNLVLENILSLKANKQIYPLVSKVLNQKTPLILASSSDIFTMDFFASARDLHQGFIDKLASYLVSHLLLEDNNKELIRPNNLNSIYFEGEAFGLSLDATSKTKFLLKDSQAKVVYEGIAPANIDLNLRSDNYTIIANSSNQVASFLVALKQAEFLNLGLNKAYLNKLGQEINIDSNLASQIMPNILSKQLRLKNRSIDLQSSTLWLTLLIVLISLEWLFRFYRRLV